MKFPHYIVHIRAIVVRKSLDILTEYEDSFATGLLLNVGPGHPSHRLLYADQKDTYIRTRKKRQQIVYYNYFSKHAVNSLL